MLTTTDGTDYTDEGKQRPLDRIRAICVIRGSMHRRGR